MSQEEAVQQEEIIGSGGEQQPPGGGQQLPVMSVNIALAMSYKPPQFSGMRTKATTFIKAFSTYKDLLGLNEKDSIRACGLAMTDDARCWFNNLTGESLTNWKKFTDSFAETFEENEYERSLQAINITQRPNQSGEEYAREILKRTRGLKYSQTILVSFMVNGLNSLYKQIVLQSMPYETTGQLLQKLRNIDLSQKAGGQRVEAIQSASALNLWF